MVTQPKRSVVERLFEVYRIAYGEQAGYWQPPSTGKALVLNDVRKAAIDKARKSYSDDGIAAALRGWRFVKWMATTTFEKDGTEHPPAELHTILNGKHIETCQQAWDRHASQSVPS